MAEDRTAITKQTLVTPFGAVTAGSLDTTLTDSDSANGNSFTCTGKELLELFNNGTAEYYVTIDSVDDEKGRDEDITTYALAVGGYAKIAVGMTTSKGWIQSGGVIHVNTEADDVQLAVLVLP